MDRNAFESISLESSGRTSLLDRQNYNDENIKVKSELKRLSVTVDQDLETSVIEKVKGTRRSLVKNVESLPLSQDCKNGASILPSSLINQILKYDLKTYYEERLAERRSFFRRVSNENIMKWQSGLISTPLTKLTKDLEVVALKIFKNLMSYMEDRKSSKSPLGHMKKHLRMMMNADEELRDEAYIQVIKQITEHKNYDKAIRGWNYLAIISSCYVPSAKLFYSIANYLLMEIKNNKDSNIVNHANYVLVRLHKSFESKRSNMPSDEELSHIEKMKPMSIPLHFFSGSEVNGEIESYTTVRELKTAVMKKLQFNTSKIAYYTLYEICTTRDRLEERYLEDGERVSDVISLWSKDIDDYMKRKEQIDFKIYVKIFLHYPYSKSDVDTLAAEYSQAVYDVIGGKYSLKEQEIITMAALQLLVECSQNQDTAYHSLQKSLEKFVPINKINLNPNLYWVEKIMELYTSFKNSSKSEAKHTYIQLLQKSPLWQAHQFVAKYSKRNTDNPENLPEDLIIGVKPNGVCFYDLERKELVFYPYSSIANWGISTKILVLNAAKSDTYLVKHYLETDQTKIIQALIESYTNLISGKSINDVQNITGEYNERFKTLVTGRTRTPTTYSKNV